MATLNQSVLGEFSGKIGGIVLKKVNGKTIAVQRVRKYNTGKSKPANDNRLRFKAAAKFARAVNDINILSSVWKTTDLKGHTPFHKIQTYNLEFIVENHPTIKNVITPPGFESQILDINYSESEFTIIINDMASSDILVILAAIINPREKNYPDFEILNLYNNVISEKEFKIKWNKNQEALISRYSEYIIYSAIIRNSDNKLSWSTTFIKQGSL